MSLIMWMVSSSVSYLKVFSLSPHSTGRSLARKLLQLTVKFPTGLLDFHGKLTTHSLLIKKKTGPTWEDGSLLIIKVERDILMLSSSWLQETLTSYQIVTVHHIKWWVCVLSQCMHKQPLLLLRNHFLTSICTPSVSLPPLTITLKSRLSLFLKSTVCQYASITNWA